MPALMSSKGLLRPSGQDAPLPALLMNTPLLELLMISAASALALALRPWQMLRAPALRSPWLAALVLLPLAWSAQRALPGGLLLQLSGASLLVLMFGWPLAMLSLLPIAAGGAWLAEVPWPRAIELLAWNGVLPGTLALLLGLATRALLPHHLMVYILARGFFGTLLAMSLAGWAQLLWQPLPPGGELGLLMVGRWLIAWGDAVLTGMLCAVFVAFRPEWLATYSDRRYLPPRQPPR